MCDAERDWEWVKRKQRWRHTAVRELEDPDELEDLQMILSLADDVDEEFMEDVTLEEAEAFEVKEVTSFLQRLSSSCEERESSLACKTRTERGENAFKALNGHSWYCYRAKENWKKSRKKGAIFGKFNGRQCQLNFAFSYGQKMSEFSKVWIAFLARAKQSRWTFWKRFSQMRKLSISNILKKYSPFPLYHNTLHSMYVVWLKIFWSCTKGSGWSLLQFKNLTVQGKYIFYLLIYLYLWTVMFPPPPYLHQPPPSNKWQLPKDSGCCPVIFCCGWQN